jgi:hypothetical protein
MEEKKWIKDGKFVELTADERKEMSIEDSMEYRKAETVKIISDVLKEVNFASEAAVKTVEAKIEEIQKNFAENELSKINSNIEELFAIVKQVGSSKKEQEKELSMYDQLKQNHEKLKTAQKGEKLTVEKTVTTTSNAVTDNTRRYVVDSVAQTPSPRFVFTDFFPTVIINDPNSFDELMYTDWDESSITRSAAARAEGGTIPTSDLVMEEKTLELKTISDSLDITTAAWKRSEIFARDVIPFLTDNMARAENAALYAGVGTGTAPMGIYTRATLFDYTSYAGTTIGDPNIADLARVLKNEIEEGHDNAQNGYMADFCFCTHSDYMSVDGFLKNANGDYIMPPKHGITFIPSSFVTTNTMVVGDSSKVKIYTTQKYEIEIGYDGTNFRKRVRTVLVDTVMNLLVREVEIDSLYKVADVTAALAAIKTP